MRNFKACISIIRIQLASTLQFRLASMTRVTTFIFWGFVHTVLILTFYRYGLNQNAGSQSGISASQAVSYVWLTQIIASIHPMLSTDSEVRDKIIKGDVGIELCRPINIYWNWFSRALSIRIVPFLLQFPPVATAAFIIPHPYNLRLPASLAGLIACILSLLSALLLSCSCVNITYGMLLNIKWGDGPVNIFLIIADILSGSFVPLQLWPHWAQVFLYLQPFAGLVDIPLRLYVGTMAPYMVWQSILLQLVWTGIFIVLGRYMINKSLKKLIIQGG